MPVADGLSAAAPAAALHPDPLLSANVYADRRLDAVVIGGLALWQELTAELEAHGGYLWTVRYSRRGEHLKLRLHAPCGLEARLRGAVEAALPRLLADLPAVDGERRLRSDVPPIDAEDEGEDAAPDRTLAWTRYRRSFVSLGSEPWLGDDVYAARMTACLGAGCGLLLSAAAGSEGLEMSHRVRQSALLKAVVGGIAALGLGPRAGEYLAYHRDWLMRFFLDDAERAAAFLARLEERAAAMGPTLERLREVTAASWSAPAHGGAAGADRAQAAWSRAASDLAAYVGGFRGHEDRRTDPFAEDPLFPAAFKALHGTANQLGLVPMEEAFVHHLLWRAAGAAEPVEAGGAGAVR